MTVIENSTGTLACMIVSDPDIKTTTFTWKLNNMQIEPSNKHYSIESRDNYSELKIFKTTRNDSAIYECEVYALYDLAYKIDNQSITLSVECK